MCVWVRLEAEAAGRGHHPDLDLEQDHDMSREVTGRLVPGGDRTLGYNLDALGQCQVKPLCYSLNRAKDSHTLLWLNQNTCCLMWLLL